MEVMIKCILQTVQGLRDVSGVVLDVCLVPAISRLVELTRQQGGRYARATSVGGHGLGPPQIYAFAAVLSFLAELPTASAADARNLSTFGLRSIDRRCDLVRMCKCAKLFDQTKRKLVMAFGHGPEALALRSRVLEVLGAVEGIEMKWGRAPAGNLERRLQGFLEDMVG